jgi:hypothetical protein
MLGSTLDTLPIRFAAVVLILGSVAYDKLVSLAVFLVIAALYIYHHNNDLNRVMMNSKQFINKDNNFSSTMLQRSVAMSDLQQGSHADVTDDMMDFMPKQVVQDNEVQHDTHNSIDEKHVLASEPLGAKAQGLFPDDMRNARSLEQWSKDGSF